MTFNPISTPHAIERCAATVAFSEPVPEKVFQKIIGEISSALPSGIIKTPSKWFKVDASSGIVMSDVGDAGPATFTTADGAEEYILAPNQISMSTSRYVRWMPFRGKFETFYSPVLDRFLDGVSPRAVRLEYLDRFNWVGDWDTFDISQLIDQHSSFVAGKSISAKRQWHSHAGWFEPAGPYRRLFNVNVDTSDAAITGTPTVGILTLAQDEVGVAGYGTEAIKPENLDKTFISSRLEELHAELKKLLTRVIQTKMAERIGLTE